MAINGGFEEADETEGSISQQNTNATHSKANQNNQPDEGKLLSTYFVDEKISIPNIETVCKIIIKS